MAAFNMDNFVTEDTGYLRGIFGLFNEPRVKIDRPAGYRKGIQL